MAKEIKMEFNKDELWCLREVLHGFIGSQIVDGHTYMLDESIELKKRIDKKCKFKKD